MLQNASNADPSAGTLKDCDLHRSIHLELSQARRLLVQVIQDCAFMRALNIMDYR